MIEVDPQKMLEKRRAAKKVIRKLFNHLKIERVVSIDDDNFLKPSPENLKSLISNIDEKTLRSIPEFRLLTFEDQDILSTQIDKLWNSFDSLKMQVIYQKLRLEHNPLNYEEDMKTLEELLGDHNFFKLSLAEWREQKDVLLKEAIKYRTLFLFDQNFEGEGGSVTGGIESIRDILSIKEYRDVVMCGLLSRTFAPGEEHHLWEEFSKKERLDQDRFVLISKSRLHDEPLGFARMIKLTALNSDCRKLKQKVSEVISNAQTYAEDKVREINIYDFEHIVFQSSYQEGIWEPDTLFRLFGLFHRIKSREEAKMDGELQEVAARIRSVSNISTGYFGAPEHSSWKIRRHEFYENEKLINALHMPIELGDIFEIPSDNETRKFVLIAQPCDLMVRNLGGKRHKTVNEGILAEIVSDTDQNGKPIEINQEAHYELPYFIDGTNRQFISFRKRYSVKLLTLDLCVFRQDGSAKFQIDSPCPDIVIPAWKTRHEKVLTKFAKRLVEQYKQVYESCETLPQNTKEHLLNLAAQSILSIPTFTTSSGEEDLFSGYISVENKTIEYNLRRYGRLCQPYAGAMLTNFASYIARTAFEHDFGKESNQEAD